jgi:NitT/TauT family transport system ATP-binding protein
MMIAGLLECTKGKIRIDGEPVVKPQTNIGIVFQNLVLVDWRDVLGNVLLQVEMRKLKVSEYEDRAKQLLSSVGLEKFAHHHPYELSGGMQQRTAFCRALVHDPPLVLMDEPLGALDAMTREQLRRDLENLWIETQKTFVFVTHDISEAVQLSDRVLVISPRPGKIEREIAINLNRPRDFDVVQSDEFHSYVKEISNIFMSYGVI